MALTTWSMLPRCWDQTVIMALGPRWKSVLHVQVNIDQPFPDQFEELPAQQAHLFERFKVGSPDDQTNVIQEPLLYACYHASIAVEKSDISVAAVLHDD